MLQTNDRSWWGLSAALTIGIAWLALRQRAADLATPMGKAVSGRLVAALATASGALPAVLITRLSPRTEDVMLGFGAGAMIWVVSYEIIPETHRRGHEQSASLGLIAGFIVMMLLDTAFG